MKFKTRIQIVIGSCLLLLSILAVYFNIFLKEIQQTPVINLKNEEQKSNSASSFRQLVFGGLDFKKDFRVAALVGLHINAKLQEMNFSINPEHQIHLEASLRELRDESTPLFPSMAWQTAALWVSDQHTHPDHAPNLGTLLLMASKAKIEKVDVPKKGTQLKVLVTLEGNQTALFKPMRYSRDFILFESPYAGADRHNGEIAAFHLSRLLNFRRAPLTVGRKVHLEKELKPVSSQALQRTYTLKQGMDSKSCFYGICYYCRPSELACSDEQGFLEGAVSLYLPINQNSLILKRIRNPWKRTYKKKILARWESDLNYCDKVKDLPPFFKYQSLYLDLIDTAIFDYLIGNADRHTLEIFASNSDPRLLLIDNGKSFGNPFWDELTILAPLYQCCNLRSTTYLRLKTFTDTLSDSLNQLLEFDPLHKIPLLTKPHLESIDRRLRIILATIELCIERDGEKSVLK